MILQPMQEQQLKSYIQIIQNSKNQVTILNAQFDNKDIVFDDYRGNIVSLITKDMATMGVGFLILSAIGAGLSAIGLGFIVAIVVGLLALGFIFSYFKELISSIIILAITGYLAFNTGIPEGYAIMICGLMPFVLLIYFRAQIILKRKNLVEQIDNLNKIIHENEDEIFQILEPTIKNYIEHVIMADIKSLQDNGLDFVPTEFLMLALENETEKGNLQLLKLPNENGEIHLYKSTNPNPQNSQMITQELVID